MEAMAKKQTRRSISLKGLTYKKLKEHCDAQGQSVSGYLEEIIAEKLDAEEARQKGQHLRVVQ